MTEAMNNFSSDLYFFFAMSEATKVFIIIIYQTQSMLKFIDQFPIDLNSHK